MSSPDTDTSTASGLAPFAAHCISILIAFVIVGVSFAVVVFCRPSQRGLRFLSLSYSVLAFVLVILSGAILFQIDGDEKVTIGYWSTTTDEQANLIVQTYQDAYWKLGFAMSVLAGIGSFSVIIFQIPEMCGRDNLLVAFTSTTYVRAVVIWCRINAALTLLLLLGLLSDVCQRSSRYEDEACELVPMGGYTTYPAAGLWIAAALTFSRLYRPKEQLEVETPQQESAV